LSLFAARGKTNVGIGDKTWETFVLDDFAELRKAGLHHPLMDEIENAFTLEKTAEPNTAQPEQVRPVRRRRTRCHLPLVQLTGSSPAWAARRQPKHSLNTEIVTRLLKSVGEDSFDPLTPEDQERVLHSWFKSVWSSPVPPIGLANVK
jgi:hypothetical protein